MCVRAPCLCACACVSVYTHIDRNISERRGVENAVGYIEFRYASFPVVVPLRVWTYTQLCIYSYIRSLYGDSFIISVYHRLSRAARKKNVIGHRNSNSLVTPRARARPPAFEYDRARVE